ncbi:oligosaccharide flippase family protein [Modestobacter sp. VKM Ac-2986]|uniref:lipopolysaccharide biosynthesis protein n=1 Tax=Modestobacter sp. VKM Ac-2986 TaxID=3004140 RepID=UPI0022AB8F6F|nr:oligosaccharide flippase family protein [Modestobacter sp. VKM Ac-2986]MCZ2830858.1 oligosaccharide flippase family protein [Modestobacter sp. VKM Ac-2986]
MSASSLLVPVAGVLTQPVLARALGAAGRGEMTAAIVPAVLAGSVATLGLPDALTYLTAKDPRVTRHALAWSVALSTVLGALCLVLAWAVLPLLSAGDAALGRLMLLAMVLTVPVLFVGAARGAAMGQQMWGAVATESLATAGLRVLLLVGLWLSGDLTPTVAVVVTFTVPLVAGVVYWPLVRRRGSGASRPAGRVLVPLVAYGGRTWFGSVASMLVAKTDQVLMTPLSSVRDLGLYSVATAVTDVPVLFALAVSNALHGVNSRSSNPPQLARATRVTLLLGLVVSVAIGATAPWWIAPLFGAEFQDAVVPTLLLCVAAVLYIPGPMAGAGLASSGRPGLRSSVYACTFAVNVTAFVLLVPHAGVVGACWASIISAAVQTGLMVLAASRVLGLAVHHFVVPKSADVTLLWREGRRSARLVLARVPGLGRDGSRW